MIQGNARILIVDDEHGICEMLSFLMRREGFIPLTAHDGKSALEMMDSEAPDAVLLDVRLPDINGMEILARSGEIDPNLPVVMITAYAEVQGAVQAMREGAHDYLSKPFDHHEVIRVVRRALSERRLKQRIEQLSGETEENAFLRQKMGPSDTILRLISDVKRVAGSDFSVLIQGESGVGKELVARAIHRSSPRANGPFIPVDCGAIPENLLESELFGYEKGAFTGANAQKIGKFEAAKGGTLFLDEISNMPFNSQAKLLRVIQEKVIYRIGSTKPVAIDVRMLAASNRDLQSLIDPGEFRHDLFFRLNDFTIKIPPLRERKDDLPYLAKRFLDATNEELKKSVTGFSKPALEALLYYHWPGNVRELRAVIRRAVLLADSTITMEHLELKSPPQPDLPTVANRIRNEPWKGLSLKEIVERTNLELEREVITEVLRQTGGNKAKAARILQVDYKTIHTKIKKLGISSD